MNMQAKFKFLVLSMALATAMMLPMNSNAQGQNDDFFRVGDENDSFRSAEWAFVISNNSFGAPLGSGLVILSVAGVGYAVVRRKRASRKGITLFLALTLCLGLTQCRKNIETISNLTTNTVRINLDIDGDSRVNVTPGASTATVTFTKGDTIFVAYKGKYVGKLGHNGSTFSGEITATPEGDDRLYFYFLGNAQHTSLSVGETTTCSAIISDQASSLPVISFAASNETFTGEGSYSAALDNKCALVKFNVTKANNGTDSNMGICITGINDKVTVNFGEPTGTDNGFSYSENGGNGSITFVKRSGDGNYWAILLPNSSVQAAGDDGTAFSGMWKGSRPELPIIENNGYLKDGIEMTVNTKYQPTGALSGEFTVSSDGKKVRFAKGNLKYTKSTGEWDFVYPQYTTVETHGQDVGGNYASQDEVTLFGWGTSGYNHGAVCYQPYSTNNSSNDNYKAYGGWYNLNDQTGQADWGYNAITSNANKQWRTLTSAEWQWMLGPRSDNGDGAPNPGVNCRESSTVCDVANARYAKAIIDSQYTGIIVFPDNYTHPAGAPTLSYVNKMGTDYSKWKGSSDALTLDQWTLMENAGAIFLPASSNRKGNNVSNYFNGNFQQKIVYYGYYWASNRFGTSGQAYYLKFDGMTMMPAAWEGYNVGVCVRLVCE